MGIATHRIDAVLAHAVASGSLVGVAAAAWSTGGLRFEGAHGLRASGEEMLIDSVAWVASMTKAVTGAAVMQLVEQGVIDLDQPAGDVVPYLHRVEVLDGFDADGVALLRAPLRPVTIRHLLTHTSGFGYDFADESLARYMKSCPPTPPGSQAGYEQPLTADPGERWSYGIGIDWAGRVVEASSGQRLDVYFREHLLGPLGMSDTTFALTPQQRPRVASMYARADDTLSAIPFGINEDPEMFGAGGGLYSTARDYLRFTRMLLGGGTLDGTRVLQAATVRTMFQDALGDLSAHGWQTENPSLSNDVELFAGYGGGWGLTFLVNRHATPEGRSPGSVAWAGLANTYYWIDPTAGVTGVFVTQVLPFFDRACLETFSAFEQDVYRAIL